jgi:polysaccharide biosynthesis/export protein
MKRLPFLKSIPLFLFCSMVVQSLSAQTAITPELIQKYQSSMGTNPSPDEIQRTIKNYQDQNNGKTAAETAANDSTKKTDSISQEKNSTASSMYELLLKGINVNPDSILKKLPVFGYDLFSKTKPSTFSPSNSGSVPADYPINAGDELIIMLWGRINEEFHVRVTRDGTINLPHNIGPVPVAGLSFEMAQKNILDRINKIEGVQGTVSMGELRSVGVFVVGEVASPGFYTVSALTNVTNALFSAGGPTKRGSLRNIQLKRNGKTVASIDFYDFLLAGTDRSGLRLQPGDVIHVPIVQSMAAIAGNVRRSALYELKGKTSLSDLIRLAGGLSPAAWSNRIQVERYAKNQFHVVLDLDSANLGLPNFDIEDGDVVKIFPVLIKDKNAVYLTGNVMRPGKYEFKPAMHITDVIPDYQTLLPETYFDYGVVMRLDAPSYLAKIIPFCLKKALDDPSSPDNLSLQAKDEIVIYSRDFFEPDRSVTIHGAVTKPGTTKLLENMKIRDLVLQAGGLSEDASPTRGELYRRKMEGKEVQTIKIDFCVACAMKDDSVHNLALERSDRVFIRQKMGWENERRATLSGEFVYPGIYMLFEGETLGDLIKRAGGFKPDAYLSASVFTRESVRKLETKRKNEYLQQLEVNILELSSKLASMDKTSEAQAMLAQQSALKEKLALIIPMGRVVIDMTNPKSYESFSLEDGDSLSIPRDLNTISVIGEVYNPSTFTFNTGNKSVKYYVESAGGLKENGDRKHTYVIKANGRIITNKMQHVASLPLEPGDVVVVPQKISFSNPQKVFTDTADAIFKLATTLAVVLSVILALKH